MITPELAFDCAWEVYKSIRADLEGIPLIDPTKVPSDHLWRVDRGPRASEYVADFSLCCKHALKDPHQASRLVLCNLFYLGLAPYDKARHFLDLREDTWSIWTQEIRKQVGREIQKRGLFPVRSYFGERTAFRVNGKIYKARKPLEINT